ncbi:MAG: TetR/AcrR family transcriptional regulator [Acidobacteriia bacterium]|nr:TetR/AcrR family transcriptional regulator [Terriglobia bacterium]
MATSSSGVRANTPNEVRLVEIYFAAAKLIQEKGFQATSLQDIAREVGLTKAGLYHYIPSKERLLYEIMNYAMDRVDRDVIAPAREIEDAERRLAVIAENYARLVVGNQEITIVLNDIGGLTGAKKRHVNQRQDAFYQFVRDTIQDLEEQHKTSGMDVSVLAMSFFGVIRWLAHWYRSNGKLSRERVIEEIRELTACRMMGLGR